MRGTLTEKILRGHLIEGRIEEGGEIGLRIDQTLTQDATGTMVYLEFEAMGLPRVKNELAVSYVDHNVIQTDYRNADDHVFLRTAAARYGVIFSPPGNGVSHHVHRERFGAPGKTLLGSDSHTTTGGSLGMLAMGAGGLSVAQAMAGLPYHITVPEVWEIRVTGRFRPFVSGKDLILTLLGEHSCRAGLGKVMEFTGPGVAGLDMAARATVANMAVDMGFTACVFPSDDVTRDFLTRNGRETDYIPLAAGPDARYARTTDVDLERIEPMAACPYNPDNVKPAAVLKNIEVSQVIIGSSCNGDFRDFMAAAGLVRGRVRHPGVSFEINPGSRQTLGNVLEAGGLRALLDAGARVHEPGCLGCIGMGQAPATGSNSLRTFPRNFKGRSGTLDAGVYLCSPETAAASALTGRITDPRGAGEQPIISYPVRYAYDPRWLITPPPATERVVLVKGPNIKPFPRFPEWEDEWEGEVLIKVGDNVSTDIIMPAGNRVLPLRSNIPAISRYVFSVIDEGFADRAEEKGGGVVVGGENYGQGSSREHAALAPRYLGVRIKLARSFARIHRENLIEYGILPLEFADPGDYDAVQPGDRLAVRDLHRTLAEDDAGDRRVVMVTVNGRPVRTILAASARHRRILRAGGAVNLARE